VKYRIVRAADVDQLRADRAELEELRGTVAQAQAQAQAATDSAIRAESVAEDLLCKLGQAHADTVAARRDTAEEFAGLHAAIRQVTAERDEALAQVLLDAEDRVALRTLLRMTRKLTGPTDRVYVLFRRGTLHSLHRSLEAAEKAAEAEGAPREGWTAGPPGAALLPATEVVWRVQALSLSTT